MAVPPTPGSLLGSSRLLTVWGTPIEHGERSPVDQLAALLAERFEIPIDEGLEELTALSPDHRYLVTELIGESRHSAVYAAIDCVLARVVALKIHRAQGDDADTKVLTEVRAASQLDHPNILQVHDLGKYDGWLYSVTELCDADMNTWCLRHGWMDVLARIIEAGEGLALLHERGIIHGDIKPPNILIKNGVAKLGDFGLVSAPGRANTVVGTPGFIAPEVAAGHRSPAGDVFALAAAAWWCLFGGLPFGEPPPDVDANAAIVVFTQRAMDGAFASPLQTRAGMPHLVMDVVQHGLHWDHEERPSLEVWVGQLQLILASAQRFAGLRERIRQPQRLVGIAFAVAFVASAGYLGLRSQSEPLEGAVPLTEQLATTKPDYRLRAVEMTLAGEGAAAVTALNDAWARFDKLSPREQRELADSATWVAERLERDGHIEHSQVAWLFAAFCHEAVGQGDQAARAREALYSSQR